MSKSQEAQEAINRLKELIKPGDTVYTTVKHVSRSGMSRSISVHVIRDNEPVWISYNVAKALGWPLDDTRESVKVTGSGMDMGFHLVYTLSQVLYPEYKCTGEHCYAAIHVNEHTSRNGTDMHKDGYALNQRWL